MRAGHWHGGLILRTILAPICVSGGCGGRDHCVCGGGWGRGGWAPAAERHQRVVSVSEAIASKTWPFGHAWTWFGHVLDTTPPLRCKGCGPERKKWTSPSSSFSRLGRPAWSPRLRIRGRRGVPRKRRIRHIACAANDVACLDSVQRCPDRAQRVQSTLFRARRPRAIRRPFPGSPDNTAH